MLRDMRPCAWLVLVLFSMTDKVNIDIVYGNIYLSPEFWETGLKMKKKVKGVDTSVSRKLLLSSSFP